MKIGIDRIISSFFQGDGAVNCQFNTAGNNKIVRQYNNGIIQRAENRSKIPVLRIGCGSMEYPDKNEGDDGDNAKAFFHIL